MASFLDALTIHKRCQCVNNYLSHSDRIVPSMQKWVSNKKLNRIIHTFSCFDMMPTKWNIQWYYITDLVSILVHMFLNLNNKKHFFLEKVIISWTFPVRTSNSSQFTTPILSRWRTTQLFRSAQTYERWRMIFGGNLVQGLRLRAPGTAPSQPYFSVSRRLYFLCFANWKEISFARVFLRTSARLAHRESVVDRALPSR